MVAGSRTRYKLESMKDDLSSKIQSMIENSFVKVPPAEIAQISGVCGNTRDEEAIEESEPFVGKSWNEITPNTWREHWCALSFLSDKAFSYFLPSLIQGSLRDYPKTINAIDSTLFSASRITAKIDSEFSSLIRWQNLSLSQIECVEEWIKWLQSYHAEDFSYLASASVGINRLLILRQ